MDNKMIGMLKPVTIGGVTAKHGLFLAPMAGMTDSAFRHIARRSGAEYCVSEMISAVAMCYGDKKTATLAAIKEGDFPLALQIFGHDPDMMAKAAKLLATGDYAGADYSEKPVAIDINMGCPVKKITSSGDGSALMREPELAARIVSSVKSALEPIGMPLTVKIRAGWDENSKNAADFAARLADAGADAIYVHARTKAQLYAPPIDLSIISAVRDAVPPTVPVIGNGDIRSADDAFTMLSTTGCDGVMIGRAALGEPHIFDRLIAASDGTDEVVCSLDIKLEDALEMLRLMIADKGETTAVREARARAAYFIRDLRGAADIRARLNKATTYGEFAAILDEARSENQKQ